MNWNNTYSEEKNTGVARKNYLGIWLIISVGRCDIIV